MVRAGLSGMVLATLLTSAAVAQGTPPLPSMPRPPSFADPAPAGAKAQKASRKPARAAAKAAGPDAAAGSSFERPNKFVPAEFDGPRGRSGGGAAPMMTGSGRPGMGMRF